MEALSEDLQFTRAKEFQILLSSRLIGPGYSAGLVGQ
jgi:hypothetical protein